VLTAVYCEGEKKIPVKLLPRKKGKLLLKPFSGEPAHWHLSQINKEYSNGQLRVWLLSHPSHCLLINEPEAIRDIQLWLDGKSAGLSTFAILVGFVVFFFLCFSAWWWLLPPLAEKLAIRMPTTLDKKIGDAMEKSLSLTYLVDTAKTRVMNNFVHTLFPGERQWKVHVVHASEYNAFAMPNASIVVFDGLLNHMQSSAELAALLGHETAHVRYRHATKAMAREWSGTFLLSLLTGFDTGVLLHQGAELRNLAFSREAELESDRYAIDMLAKKRIPMSGMVHLFDLLGSAKGSAPPEWMSTHPDTKVRRQYASEALERLTYKNDSLLCSKLESMLKEMQTGSSIRK
jgi:Zn-dependent protease with chaperone function